MFQTAQQLCFLFESKTHDTIVKVFFLVLAKLIETSAKLPKNMAKTT